MSTNAPPPPSPAHDPGVLPAEIPAEPSAGGRGYETRDTNVRAILVFTAGVLLFGLVAQVGLWGFLRSLTGSEPERVPKASAIGATPETLTGQLRRLHAEEDATLAKFSIDNAIDRIAEHGLPPASSRTPARTEVELNSHAGTPAPPDQAKARPQAEPKPGEPPAPKTKEGSGAPKSSGTNPGGPR
jgi:hypothetical protein